MKFFTKLKILSFVTIPLFIPAFEISSQDDNFGIDIGILGMETEGKVEISNHSSITKDHSSTSLRVTG
jgi:hypothetical protein